MTPEWMTNRDIERARELRISLIVDLRGPDAPGSGPLSLSPTRRVAVYPNVSPTWTSVQEQMFLVASPGEALPMLLERSAPAFLQAVTLLSGNPGGNSLLHCRLGKDRTGVLSALLLKLFEVDDSDVIADYMYSAALEGQARRRMVEVGVSSPHNESRVARETASTQAIEALLVVLREKYGGARQYFEHRGISGVVIDQFVDDLLH